MGGIALAEALLGGGAGGGGFSVSISPAWASGSGTSGGGTVGPVTAIPAGSSGPFTYLWEVVSEDGCNCTINSPAAATTTFHLGAVAASDTGTAVVKCTVSDGVNTASKSISVQYTNRSTA